MPIRRDKNNRVCSTAIWRKERIEKERWIRMDIEAGCWMAVIEENKAEREREHPWRDETGNNSHDG